MKRRAFITSAAATVAAATLPGNRLWAAATGALPGDLAARTLAGGETTLPGSVVRDFVGSLRGGALLAGDTGYDGARRVWNGMIDRRPAIIARCAGAADVINAVNFARDNNLLVAVRGGGHSMSGQSVCDGGLMIDLSPMRWVRVDPVARRAVLGPGTLLGDLDREATAFGLVTTAGTVSHTGAAGLTLGGGQGRLQRIHGLACDNLRAAELVTANGRFTRASASENPELFWALRGGGGNFGVVTSFEYELHPFGGMVLGGALIYPYEQAREVCRFYAEFTQTIPDELHLVVAMVSPRGGKPMISIDACYTGDLVAGERVLAPLRRFGKPMADQIKAMPYVTLQTSADKANAPGRNYYAKSGFLREISPALIDAYVEGFPASPKRATVAIFQQFGGAMGRIPADATAYPHRDAAYEVMVLGGWANAADTDENMADLRRAWDGIGRFTDGFYVNTGTPDDDDKVRANYGRLYERLSRVKTQYDPGNLFRLNANIKPA
jgi:FAD/FMN-containing dehydrogenase